MTTVAPAGWGHILPRQLGGRYEAGESGGRSRLCGRSSEDERLSWPNDRDKAVPCGVSADVREADGEDLPDLVSAERAVAAGDVDVDRAVVADAAVAAAENDGVFCLLEANGAHVGGIDGGLRGLEVGYLRRLRDGLCRRRVRLLPDVLDRLVRRDGRALLGGLDRFGLAVAEQSVEAGLQRRLGARQHRAVARLPVPFRERAVRFRLVPVVALDQHFLGFRHAHHLVVGVHSLSAQIDRFVAWVVLVIVSQLQGEHRQPGEPDANQGHDDQ
eukprot:CAMPEP_0197387170 /NCGR_PEP_ID=MMETSP1165-20131217/363_1 /TAXON_ID=284809 /ORGANISM="Chrysocystis fragilis, Strain CCMP3189" /LENGTH=271 /DNA_ID=CAMNT_0042912477 /DNA_START=342 /DNA_END=1158 /DNA_ORIENTATION=+